MSEEELVQEFDRERIKIVKEYLARPSNHGKLKSQIARELQQQEDSKYRISYVKALNVLDQMAMLEIVTLKKRNDRDIEVILNKDNPLTTIPKQLNEFRDSFKRILESAARKTIDIYGKPRGPIDHRYIRYLTTPLAIYALITRIHNNYAVLIWPTRYPNTSLRKELYSVTFSILVQIQEDVQQIFRQFDDDVEIFIQDAIMRESDWNEKVTPNRLFDYLIILEKDGFGDDGKSALDALWLFSLELVAKSPLQHHYLNHAILDNPAIDKTNWRILMRYDRTFIDSLHNNSKYISKSKYAVYWKPELTPHQEAAKSIATKQIDAFRSVTTIKGIESLTKEQAEQERNRATKALADAFAYQKEKLAGQIINVEQVFVDMLQAASANLFFSLTRLGYTQSEAIDMLNEEVDSHYHLLLNRKGKSLIFGASELINPSR